MRRTQATRGAGLALLLLLLVSGAVVLRYRLFRQLQSDWVRILGVSPSAVDTPDREEELLDGRLEELGGMDPDRVAAAVSDLAAREGLSPEPVSDVSLLELNLDRAVPVNMRRGESPEGISGIWIRLRDDQRREAEFHVPEDQAGPEELRALRAFELIENTPMLHHLRPILFNRLMKTLPDD